MQILSEDDLKNLDSNTPDVSIGIADEKGKDDIRKFKFKRPLMLKIFVPLCILTLSSTVVCLLTLSNKYEIVLDKNLKLQDEQLQNLIYSGNIIREKRELQRCEECEEELEEELQEELENSVYRCKKNIAENKDCCDLYKKVKKLNKVMEDVKKEFSLLNVPCKNQDDNADDSSSSSSDEDKNKENKSGNKDENAAEEDNKENSDEIKTEANENIPIEKADTKIISPNFNEYELDGGNEDNTEVNYKLIIHNNNQEISNSENIPNTPNTDYDYDDSVTNIIHQSNTEQYLETTTKNINLPTNINKLDNSYDDTDDIKESFTTDNSYGRNIAPVNYNKAQIAQENTFVPVYSQIDDNYENPPIPNGLITSYATEPATQDFIQNGNNYYSNEEYRENAYNNNNEFNQNQNYGHESLEANFINSIPSTPKYVNHGLFNTRTEYSVDMNEQQIYDTPREDETYHNQHYDFNIWMKTEENTEQSYGKSDNFQKNDYNTEMYPKIHDNHPDYSNIINNNFEDKEEYIPVTPEHITQQNSFTTQHYNYDYKEEPHQKAKQKVNQYYTGSFEEEIPAENLYAYKNNEQIYETETSTIETIHNEQYDDGNFDSTTNTQSTKQYYHVIEPTTPQYNYNDYYNSQENQNSEQNYNINVNIKVENSAETLSTTTAKQQHDYNNFEENQFNDNQNIDHDKQTTTENSVTQHNNNNFEENHYDYTENDYYNKQSTTTTKSVNKHPDYDDYYERNHFINNYNENINLNNEQKLTTQHNNNNFEENHHDYTENDYYNKQSMTTMKSVNKHPDYDDNYERNHFINNYNENINFNNEQKLTTSTTSKYINDKQYNEDYYVTSTNFVNEVEKTIDGIDFLDQIKNMQNVNEDLILNTESTTHVQFYKNVITPPAILYDEEIQTKKYKQLNNDQLIQVDYHKQPEEHKYDNEDESINVHVNIYEEISSTSKIPSITTTENYNYKTKQNEYYSDNDNDFYNNYHDTQMLPENKIYLTQTTTTEEQELMTQSYKTTPMYEDNDSYINNNDNNEEHFNIKVNIDLKDSSEKSTTEYTKASSSQIPPVYDYEKELKKSNYYKDGHVLKPELMHKKTNIDIDHDYVGNSQKYYRDTIDNEDSVDEYTDNQGNFEDIENSQENINIAKIRTSTTTKYKIYAEQITEQNNIFTDSTVTEKIEEVKEPKYYNTDWAIENHDEEQKKQAYNEEIKSDLEYNHVETTSHAYYATETNLNYLETNENSNEWKIKYPQKIKTSATEDEIDTKAASLRKLYSSNEYTEQNLKMNLEENIESTTMKNTKSEEVFDVKSTTINVEDKTQPNLLLFPSLGEVESIMPMKTSEELAEDRIKHILQQNNTLPQDNESDTLKLNYPTPNPNFYIRPHQFQNNINETDSNGKSQPRIQDVNGNDLRIVNQNPIAQRFQNTGTSKFDNIFPLPPIETSKASQQLTVNTNMLPMCFYGMPNQNGQLLRQPGFDAQINPFSMGAYGYPQMFLNNVNQQPMHNYYNSMMAQQKYSQPNLMHQPPYMNSPYFCTYVPSSSLQFPPITAAQEFRNIESKHFPLPEDIDDKTIPENWIRQLMNSNKTRSSVNCLPGERSCLDGTRCIKNHHWCDGFVHCPDKSDELGCPCKTRVDKTRLCDGYFDCPNGEDELGCFGCNEEEFSCDDWSERHKSATCVSLLERCDGVPQCRTGKDEMDCSLLTNSINVHQTYAVSKSTGYLHRNFKGNWYPVCSNEDTWVLDACLAEVGPQATLPLVHMLPVPSDYTGQFLTAIPNKKVEFLKSCIGGEAVYIICPPIPCGTRLLPPPNHFRKQEVDTSAEEDFLPFVSRLRRFTDDLYKSNQHPDVLSSNDFADKKQHVTLDMHVNQHIDIHSDKEWAWEDQERHKRGDSRVVGGKPSQPTSWPWVVAIYRDGIFHCGGVLMSELWVITAAHCVDTYWQHYYEVQAGMLRRFSFSPMEQNRVVSNIIGHQMYDRTDMKNDLALLKVAQPFQFNRWVRPVCLPSESSAGPNWMWGPNPGTICTAVGWGATIEHGPDPDHMREVEVPILSHCKHREDQEGQEICAGYLEGGRDACQGDSGGPLLCRNPIAPSQWYVAGIVSHGEGCARPNEPGAYTRVSLYLNWIARSILDENLPKRIPIQKCPGTLCLGTRRCISKKRHCDKTIDCLVGDDEINCPKSDYSSLIKHAFENMLLFAPNNMTTAQPEDSILSDRMKETERNEPRMETNDAERKGVKSGIATIAEEHTTENDSAFKEDGGQAAMNRNGGISSTTAPLGEISDITRPITNPPQLPLAPTAGETPKASITPSTFITADDTISESTTRAELTTLNDVTVTTSIRTTEIPTPGIINDSPSALNTNDKNMVDTDHKTETTTPGEIKTETSTAFNAADDNLFPMNNHSGDSKSIEQKMPTYFECRKMLQLIPMSRRCDNKLDCEDGTDEAHCSCKGYLFASHPSAICDGIIDCADGSDERDCINCPDTHFHCHLSQQCVPKLLQCNHEPDCFFSEDEWDCFALTNSTYIRYDSDERPELRGKGVMSFSFSGKWFPLCNNNWFQTAHDVAGDMCAYLGFSGYQKYFEAEVKQSSLEILERDQTSLSLRSSTNETCRGLYVKCSNSLSDTGDMKKIYTAHQSGANTFKEVLMSPWNAAVFVDGVYTCSGTLIEKNWVITPRTCLHHIHLHMNYTTVMLGTGRGHFNVIGPHEQIRLVSEIIPVIVTDVLLLKLQKPVIFTRYVRPLYVRNINNDIMSERETCLVLGKEHDSFMQLILLKPVLQKCLRGKRCFKRVTPLGNCDAATSAWGGTIVCLSETGWYPAAVYYDQKGICGFRTTTEYTSIRGLKARIITAMNKRDFPVSPPNCNGIRCPLGQCITSHRICDGISDCREGSDENEELCYQKSKNCTATKTCECAPTELSCHNGRCVPKSAFCDRVNDCGDWSDEPARCNCSTYLALVAPHRLCDGISNCHDKTDENPRFCACKEDSFKCGKSDVCVSNDWVCDGDFDCPGKEDELFCLALRAPEGGRDGVGEVVLRSYGVWHSYCVRDKPLTTPDLVEICTDLGFQAGHAAAVNRTFTRPAQDIAVEHFSLVRFNEHVMMFLRGNYPMAKLQTNEKCERLYIECTPP